MFIEDFGFGGGNKLILAIEHSAIYFHTAGIEHWYNTIGLGLMSENLEGRNCDKGLS